MSALTRKLLRELTRLKGQVLTIALVVACGIAAYVTLRSTWVSLETSKTSYYEQYRFADVFARLKRAPRSVVGRIEGIPGVAAVYPRVVHEALLPIDTLPEPATGRLVSIPTNGRPPLNRLHLRAGRFPTAGEADEAIVVDTFAKAHGFGLGSTIPAVLNGTRRDLRVVGIALSPEYMILAQAGALAADEERFAVLWMHADQLAPAFGMEGAFNDVTLRLQPGANELAVVDELDRMLEPYGGLGAVPRSKQTSNYFLESELMQLETFATMVPAIFLSVAAFLLNVVMSRLVGLQREQIAVLKACGYTNVQVGLHYLALVTVIVFIGAVAGIGIGGWLGSNYTELYTQFFHFPHAVYGLDFQVVVVAVGVSFAAAAVGALGAVAQAVRLPPAEAMRPAAPAMYRRSMVDRLGLSRFLGVSSMMMLRELQRRPLRTLFSSLGVAAAVGIMVVGQFGFDSFEYLIQGPLHEELRGDMTVAFFEPQPTRITRNMRHIPGVLAAEGNRGVPVRFRSGSRWRDSALLAVADEPELRRIVNRSAEAIPLNTTGLTISEKMGEVLGVGIGDEIDVEIREGNRETRRMLVTQTVDDAFGLNGYMTMSALHEELGQEHSISIVHLRVDPTMIDSVYDRLEQMPKVAQVTRKTDLVRRFEETSGQYMLVMTLILTGFGSAIAIGVVYNNARIALATRARDFATLRILGFSRAEVSAILLGELSIQVVLAIPIGLMLGTWWAEGIMSTVDPELYRLPVVISASSYAFAVAVAVGAGIISALLVRRRVDHLDLTSVLKAGD